MEASAHHAAAQPIVSDVDEAGFEQAVVERSKTTPVLVDFWAAWCGPCRALTPQIEAAVTARGGEVALAKVDTEANPGIARRFNISGIPHVKLFHRGHEVAHFVGARPQSAIDAFLDEHLGPSAFEQLLANHREAGEFDDAIAAFDLGYVEQGLQHLLERVQQSDGAQRDAARAFMVAAFDHHGARHPSVVRYRKQLATALF